MERIDEINKELGTLKTHLNTLERAGKIPDMNEVRSAFKESNLSKQEEDNNWGQEGRDADRIQARKDNVKKGFNDAWEEGRGFGMSSAKRGAGSNE